MSQRSSTPRASASPTESSSTTTSRPADETTPLTGGDPKMSRKRRVFLLACLCYTATWTIAATKFRDNVSTVVGILEMGLGVGYVIGPATGGGLFRLAGFPAPFFIIGGLILIGLVLFPFVVRDTGNDVVTQQTTEATVPKLLRNFWIWMTSLCLMICTAAWGFINTTSSTFLHSTFGFDPALVGLIMFYYAIFYITSSPIIGLLATKFGRKKFLIPGILIQGVAMLFLGPSFLLALLPKKQSLWLFLTTSAVFAVSSSCVAPCVADMLHSAERMGYSKSVALNGVVSGLASSFFFLGSCLGPLVTGLLSRVMDYQHSSTVFGLFLAAFAYIYLIIALCFRNRL